MTTNNNNTLAPVVRGDAWQCTITLVATDGTPVDLTGYTIVASAVVASRREKFVLTVTRSDALGVIVLSATRAQTAEWVDAYAVFDVRYTSPSGVDDRTPKLHIPVSEGVSP